MPLIAIRRAEERSAADLIERITVPEHDLDAFRERLSLAQPMAIRATRGSARLLSPNTAAGTVAANVSLSY